MPIGAMINSCCIVVGGTIGCLLKNHLSDNLRKTLNLVLAFCAMTLGLCSIIKLSNLTIVIASILLGAVMGEVARIYEGIKLLSTKVVDKLYKNDRNNKENTDEKVDVALIASAVIIFCFSGTGIFGAITEGISQDASILIAKSVLDVFTAMILASSAGKIIMFLALPQFAIMTALFFLANALAPIFTQNVSNNFVAVGGLITLMTGFNLLKLKEVRVLSVLPSMVLVVAFSSWF